MASNYTSGLAHGWKKYGIIPHVFDAKWTIEEPNFDKKFKRALTLVDTLAKLNTPLSIVGNSAGSSFALSIFEKRKKYIQSVVINCGRIRTGDWSWFTFNQATASSPSFKQSVLMSEKIERTLSKSERRKILTLRPVFDEVVPPATIVIDGATNEVVPTIEHSVSIALTMTVCKKRIIKFIVNNDKDV